MKLALLTDLYQLTMLEGYFQQKKLHQRASFDLYFRKIPQGGGFCIAAGLEMAVTYLTQELHFDKESIDYLASLNIFSQDFLNWLSNFTFSGDVYAIPEGSLVFPNQPLLRVEASLAEAQLIESTLLNLINFQTLVATKAARMVVAAKGGDILEFGLRRSQGVDGAVSASRAAYIGGCVGTSNTLAGYQFGIPVAGTHAHSWVMSFESEIEAFMAYARTFPNDCTLLVDTYDTLNHGVPNAIRTGQYLRENGYDLKGIRLDSGDLAKLSIQARTMLDEAGFTQTKIVASNDLDEYLIANLKSQGAKIDVWGVGTNLVTSKGEPALGGVYKLNSLQDNPNGTWTPKIKVSGNPQKTTIPGRKQVWRGFDSNGIMLGDVLTLAKRTLEPKEQVESMDPLYAGLSKTIQAATWKPMLEPTILQGKRVLNKPESLTQLRERTLSSLKSLDKEVQRRVNPHIYPVGLEPELFELRNSLLKRHQQK